MIIENVTLHVESKILHHVAYYPLAWFPIEEPRRCSWCHYYADSVIQSTCNIQDCWSSVSADADSWLTDWRPAASYPPGHLLRPCKSLHGDAAAKPRNITLPLLPRTASGSRGLVRVMGNKWESFLKVIYHEAHMNAFHKAGVYFTQEEEHIYVLWSVEIMMVYF